jgi:decaprenylphospho-beta-D-erythro-pentofuranosid-2-ulose 2-reductase
MSENKKRIVVIGATSAIAEHCARLWIKEKTVDLTLVGRDLGRLERVAADLRVRSPQSVIRALVTDFIDPLAIRRLVDEIMILGAIDIALIAHGSLPDQQMCEQDITLCHEALSINGISPVLFAQAFVGHMQQANHGTLAMIGSVAGDRGRKSNYVYGAAKGLVARYAQGLQHKLAYSKVKVVLVKPGPTDTPMTYHLKQKGQSLASASDVAQAIVNGIDSGKAVVYTPTKWFVIMMIIRHLPMHMFNKLNI